MKPPYLENVPGPKNIEDKQCEINLLLMVNVQHENRKENQEYKKIVCLNFRFLFIFGLYFVSWNSPKNQLSCHKWERIMPVP
jgi:hypothetical protein